MKRKFSRQIFEKKDQVSHLIAICSVGAELFHEDGQTDMSKLIVALRNSENAPKDIYYYSVKCQEETSGVSSPHHNKNRSSYQCIYSTSFSGTADTFTWSLSCKALSIGTLKKHLVNSTEFTRCLKAKRQSTNAFVCLSNHSLQPRNVWRGATLHDKKCPCVRGFRWMTFSAFIVNCDLINNKN
jgi:hypothetical protein